LEVQEIDEREALRVKMQLHELERDFDLERQKNQARDGRKRVPRAQGTTEKKKVENCTKPEGKRLRRRTEGKMRTRGGAKVERKRQRKEANMTVAVFATVTTC
jgi:hypothetical protein